MKTPLHDDEGRRSTTNTQPTRHLRPAVTTLLALAVAAGAVAAAASGERSSPRTYINSGFLPSGPASGPGMSADRAQKPASVNFQFIRRGKRIRGFYWNLQLDGDVGVPRYPARWSSWGGARAKGAGILYINWELSRVHAPTGNFKIVDRGETKTPRAALILGGRVNCAGQALYTRYKVELPAGTTPPRFFDHLKEGGASCQVYVRQDQAGAPAYNPNTGASSPTFNGMRCGNGFTQAVDFTSGCWRWKGWNSKRATGTGFIRTAGRLNPKGLKFDFDDTRIYLVRIVVSRPRWCGGMVYTRQRVVAYGSGIADTYPGEATRRLPKSMWRRLRASARGDAHRRVYDSYSQRGRRCDR